MSHYILRYTGPGREPPAADVAAVRRAVSNVVDSSDRMLLVDSSEATIDRVMSKLHGWVVAPERMVPRPRTRPAVVAAASAGARRPPNR
jgi:hypothetical protein